MKKNTFLLIIVVVCACETLRDIEIEREPDKLVLYGSFHSDSVMQITLATSLFITDHTLKDYSVRDAEVDIYQDDMFIERLRQLPSEHEIEYSTNYKCASGFIPERGASYRIEVASPGYETISAETLVPSKININDVEYTPNEVPINSDYSGYPASILLQEDSKETNYYILRAYMNVYELNPIEYWDHVEIQRDTVINELRIMPRAFRDLGIGSEDPFKEEIYFSSDELTGNNLKKYECYVSVGFGHPIPLGKTIYPNGYEQVVRVAFKLVHITKAHYEYGRTVALQLEKGDDPFAEPVLIKSNVEGGLGIFAGYSETLSEEVTSDKIHYGE